LGYLIICGTISIDVCSAQGVEGKGQMDSLLARQTTFAVEFDYTICLCIQCCKPSGNTALSKAESRDTTGASFQVRLTTELTKRHWNRRLPFCIEACDSVVR
jgi:hypothetical protein